MNMKKIVLTIICTLLGVGISNTFVQAQEQSDTLDITTVTCKDLLLMDSEQRDSTIAFFHGVMTGKSNTTVLDGTALSNTTDKVMEHCINNPQDKVLAVFEKSR